MKNFLLLLFTIFFGTALWAQPNCGDSFYDSGGAAGDYDVNENITTTICPDNSGDVVTVSFVSFDTENGYDFLNIYDGNDATGNNLGQFSGTSNPGAFTSTSADGCLTFVFTSDGSVTSAGWEANVTCAPRPSCPIPTNLSADNITDSGAELSWTAGGSETSWNIEYGPTGYTQGSGTAVNGVTNPYTLSSLTSTTEYDYYVQADCTTDGTSDWVGPFTFATVGTGYICETAIEIGSIPYTTTDNTSNYGDDYSGTAGTDCGSGSGYLNGDDVVYVYTPSEDGCVNIKISELTANYAGVFVYADCSDIGNTCLEGAVAGNSSDDQEITGVNLTANTPIYIVVSTWPAPQSVGYTLDVFECPACPVPTNLSASNIIDMSAELSWTAGGSETSWNIEWGTSGFTQGSGTLVNGVTNPYTLSGLTAETEYQYYVQADCTTDGTSDWAGPFTFTTLPPPPPNNECANAKPLDCITNTSYTGETTVGSTDNGDDTGCAMGAGVWYKFNGEGTITVTSQAGTGFDHEMAVATSTDCVSFENIDCEDTGLSGGEEVIEFTAEAGIDYYIYVGHYAINTTGTFDISVTCATCVAPTFTVAAGSNNCPTEEFFIDVDVTDLGSGSSVDVTDGTTTLTAQSTGTYTFGPYAASTAIDFTVSDNADSNCSATESYTTPASCPPSNDNMSNPILLTVDQGCTGAPYTTLGATGESGETVGSCFSPTSSINNSVWFEFVAPCAPVTVTTDFGGGTMTDTEISVYDSDGNEMGCDQDGGTTVNYNSVLNLSNLNDGESYMIQVDGWNGNNGTFCIEVQSQTEGSVVLQPNDYSSSAYCDDGSWTYYKNGDGDKFFAINWGSSNAAAKKVASVSITTGAMGTAEDTGTPEATYTMERYWNVDLGGESLNENVSVRFYYDPAEKTAVDDMASTFATTYSVPVEPAKWFKTISGDFDPNSSINATTPVDVIELDAQDGLMENGVTYVEFSNVSSFSGGTYAAGAGTAPSSLPIELLSFNAREKGVVNMITWSTASEINTKEMMIQASPDGKAWKEIGKVESRGSERTGSEYEIVDNDPYFKTYYRIVTEDFDGSIERSRIVYVTRKDDSAGWKVSIAPNPTQHNTILNFDSYRSENIVVSVIDMTGKLVSQTKHQADKGLNQYEIDLADQSSGLYIVKISSDSRSETLRVSKM